jgi:hypothetical protein
MEPATGLCASCGTALQGAYCHACGERRIGPGDLRLGAFLHDAFHFQTHLDNKVVRTALTLVRRPGLLTAEWAAGRRQAYAKPVQLFVVVNLLFFLVAPKLGILRWKLGWFLEQGGVPGLSRAALDAKRQALGLDWTAFQRLFDQGLDPHKKWLFLILIPLTALLLWALHPRRRLVEHLVFAIHYACALFLFLLGIWGLFWGVSLAFQVRFGSDAVFASIGLAVFSTYLALGIRRVYGTGRIRAVAEGLLVALVLLPAVVLGQRLAFLLAFRGLG